MSLPQGVELLSIPLIAGAVGYITNKLAIIMLFRPYKRKWYTFGWVGIVPRTRPKLAATVGEAVAKKLLSPADLAEALNTPLIHDQIKIYFETSIKNITLNNIEQILDTLNIDKILRDNRKNIDKFIQNIINDIISSYLNRPIPFNELEKLTSAFLNDGKVLKVLSSALSDSLKSETTLLNTLPDFILSQKSLLLSSITEKATNTIKHLGRSMAVKESVAKRVIVFKNSLFSGGGTGDFIKMGFVNMVMDDKTIADTVKRELPAFMDSIANDPDIKNKIYEKIEADINLFLNSPINSFTLKLKSSQAETTKYFEKIITQSFSSVLEKFKLQYPQITLAEFLQPAQPIINDVVGKFSPTGYLLEFEGVFKKLLCETIYSLLLKNIASLSSILSSRSVLFFQTYAPKLAEQANLQKTVESKINAMPLEDVENLLFSFMQEHFKWINRLGFVLGFIIGAIQAAVIFFLS